MERSLSKTDISDKYKSLMLDDIVDVILKAEQYEYYDLKQRNIQMRLKYMHHFRVI